jgi:hypothetical protein
MNQAPDHRESPDTTPGELERYTESRLKAIEEADRPGGYAIRLGASNPPFDCEIFSPDYRSRLPKNDPARKRSPLREYGTQASLDTMKAAHNACLKVLGISISAQR